MKNVDVKPSDFERIQESYTAVPYLSQAYLQSHPDQMATIGRIFGMSPASITQCRVLELGCAGGGNIIPMAYFLPESDFKGIELNEGHVKKAHRTISDLGLSNIRIDQGNILDIDESWGKFDYIICHGVFSWVPETVQEKIFSISVENLAEKGIAYISYNTYPGWHMREMIRHMMLYHAGQFETPRQRLDQGTAFVEYLAKAMAGNSNDPYGLLLKNELEALKSSEEWYLFHDYMEVVNAPIYFHQFIDRADQNNLQYLGEANFPTMFSHGFSEGINRTLEEISRDIVQKEQYMDFLRNRLFRQTLLCHKCLNLNRTLDSESLAGLLISSDTVPEVETRDLSPGVIQKFRISDGTVVETENPIIKAAFWILRESWPKVVSFERLYDMCFEAISSFMDHDTRHEINWRHELGRGLLHCYASGAVDAKTWESDYTGYVTEKPKVSRLALYQSKNRQRIVNARHEIVTLDPMARQLLPMLDGTNDRNTMVQKLTALVRDGAFTLTEYDVPITEKDEIYRFVDQSIDKILSRLAEETLLIG